MGRRISKLVPLFLVGTLAGLLALTGCQSSTNSADTGSPQSQAKQTTSEVTTSGGKGSDAAPNITEYKQSPFLDGKGLPPVKDRLPNEPKLLNEMPPDMVKYEIGTYGGTLRLARTDPKNDTEAFIIENEPLVNTPGMLGQEVTPNIVKDFKVSDDKKEFTFNMREGLKWSDGQPVTSDDVKFAVEDVLMNKELTPLGFPSWLRSGGDATGTPAKFDFIDPYTFRITFDKPYGGFLLQLAWQGWRGYNDLLKPKHYLKQFHTKYTPLAQLEPLIKAAGFQPGEWVNLFNQKDITNSEITQPEAIGFPVLNPYIEVKSGETIEFERNPYYFKIDAKGNQLPYIDKMTSIVVQDVQMLNLKIMTGEVDHSYEYVSLPELALLKDHEKQGGYKIYLTKLHRTAADIELNLTYNDPTWRKVVRDLRFRQALNLALNKKEIVDSVFYSFAKPYEVQGTTQDLAAANKLLDDMGMTKGADGFRVGPDGKKFSIPIEFANFNDDLVKTAQLVVEQWKQLGLDVTMKQIDSSLWSTRNTANDLQATVMFTPGPVQWVREEWGQDMWAPLWSQWWSTGGQKGEEPPAEVKSLFQKIYSMRQMLPDEARKEREQIEADFGKNLWYFIPAQDIALPVAVNAKIGNFSDNGWGIAQSFGGEAWFFKK